MTSRSATPGSESRSGQVMSVLGPVRARDLGITLPHEHLVIDLSCLWSPPVLPWQEPLVDVVPSLENRGLIALDAYVNRANLLLDEPDVAMEELRAFRELGGGCIVDLTVEGIDPQPLVLREISRSTGLHIVAGCGHYVQCAHDERIAHRTVQELADELLRDIQEGFGDTGVRPGIIGEIGTSSPIHPDEAKVLQAAAGAQSDTGLAINVHVSIFAREALKALRILEEAGADLSRVIVSHLDEMLDLPYHVSILETGACVEFDTFGSEFCFEASHQREPSDWERQDALLRLLDAGWASQLLVSQDVCNKLHLLRYGGVGYGHILRSIVPRLRTRGVDDPTIETMIVRNPARLLQSTRIR